MLSSRSEVEFIDPSLVPTFVEQILVDQYFQVAVVTVLAYDNIITLDKEVKYFWNAPWQVVKLVYFANRYIGLLGAIAFLAWNSFEATVSFLLFGLGTLDVDWVGVVLIDYILMIRVLALYSHSRMIVRALSIFLKVFLAFEAVLKLGIFIYGTLAEQVAIGGLAEGVTFCGDGNVPLWQMGILTWTVPLAFGFLLMVLALYKAAEYWKLAAGFKGFRLINVLVQDQVIYFMLAMTCSIINIILYKLALPGILTRNILVALGNPSFLCILGSRLLINLKEAAEQGFNEGVSYRRKNIGFGSETEMSVIEFA